RQQRRQMNEHKHQTRLMLADQVEMLRQEVTQLRGEVEKLSWQSGRQSQDGPQIATHAFADPQEQVAFETAMELYRNGEYQEAASALNAFVEAYPEDRKST